MHSCWSHRTKGKVLTEEQIATCEKQFAAVSEMKRWQAELGVWQSRLLLPVFLKYGEGHLELTLAVLCAASFAGGGYLVGGAKALKIACPLLIVASLAATFHLGGYLLDVLRGEASLSRGFILSAIRLVFCGTIIVSAVMILRLKRPAV